MDLRIWKWLLMCFLLSFLIGCASTGSPSGGPKDNAAPVLVVEKSSKNFSTNYTPEKIELVFDEWIELKNQQREILISPPFFTKPKITSRGKKVTVEFPEEEPLREDATYTLNFGKSIVDFTEANPADGFRFVFATGDKIDSLKFDGSIEDAIDGEPVKDILVLLYDVLEDSVVLYEKPFYYARTDDSGDFKFENLKNDTFKLLVLEDLNFNYLVDPEIERLAFPDSLFILNDSTRHNPKLRLFKPQQSLKITNSSSKTPGLITTIFNKQAEEVGFEFLYPEDFEPIVEYNKDTIMYWFSEPRDSVGVIYGVDTLDFMIKAFDSLFYAGELAMIDFNAAKENLAPFDSLRISFIAPLAEIDTSLIRLTNQPYVPPEIPIDSLSNGRRGKMKDTTRTDSALIGLDTLLVDSIDLSIDTLLNDLDSLEATKDTVNQLFMESDSIVDTGKMNDLEIDTLRNDSLNMKIDTTGIDSLNTMADTVLVDYEFGQSVLFRDLMINSKWEEKSKYRLQLLPGALTDIYGRQNDSLILDFKTAGLDEFGNIAINLSGLDSGQNYVVLLKLNDEVIKKSQVIDVDSTTNKIEHKRLRVNTYSIELIKDDNGDGEWTTGDYWLKRQPEESKKFTLEKLRENWDLEANVYWNKTDAIGIDTSEIAQDSTLLEGPRSGLKNKKSKPKGDKSPRKSRIDRDPKGRNE